MGVKIPLDFSNTPESGSVRVPEGDYLLKIKKAEKRESSQKKTPGLYITFEFASGPKDIRGRKIQDRHWLTAESLWTLRNMLEAMGYNVPSSNMKLDVDKMLIGRTVGASVIDGDEYKGKIRSEIGDYLPKSAVDNKVSESTDVTEDEDDEDEEDDDALGVFASDDDDEDEEEGDEDADDLVNEDDDEEESFAFEDDEDEEEEEAEVEFSFGPSDIEEAKGPQLKEFMTEAKNAGFEFDLPKQAKVSQVREALLALFENDGQEDEEEMEDFDLDDV